MQVPCRGLLRYYRSEHDAEAYPCPAGTLGLMPGATSHKNCSPCPAGYICKMTDEGGKYLRSSAEPCPAGHICLRDAVACPAPKRLDQCSRRAGEFVVYKDEGYKATAYCAEGTVHPDDAKKNTSAANGLFSLEGYGSCMSCPAGYTCEGDLFPDPVP
ncbi:hypothetical protein, conserved [Eimeria necatrix]|uniref:Uncharacterized protein n=1 Tax=Eimeria necatrix TaxID=51315 RepID=U6MVU2_9EIME|nr:hypothetical protein, conserved [Eimeria necatrix]CDJ66599.1 hypothetical protein, conserved [Eimeria necatrix]